MALSSSLRISRTRALPSAAARAWSESLRGLAHRPGRTGRAPSSRSAGRRRGYWAGRRGPGCSTRWPPARAPRSRPATSDTPWRCRPAPRPSWPPRASTRPPMSGECPPVVKFRTTTTAKMHQRRSRPAIPVLPGLLHDMMRPAPQGRHLLLGIVDDRRDDVIELVTHRRRRSARAAARRLLLHPEEPLAVPPGRRPGRWTILVELNPS